MNPKKNWDGANDTYLRRIFIKMNKFSHKDSFFLFQFQIYQLFELSLQLLLIKTLTRLVTHTI